MYLTGELEDKCGTSRKCGAGGGTDSGGNRRGFIFPPGERTVLSDYDEYVERTPDERAKQKQPELARGL